MSENANGTGKVSWRIFNELYESQFDFFRKLRFFIKAGRFDKNEELALELIEEFLTGKQEELEVIRKKGLEEWESAGQISNASTPTRSVARVLSSKSGNTPGRLQER